MNSGRAVVVLSGRMACGKSSVAAAITREIPASVVSTRDVLRALKGSLEHCMEGGDVPESRRLLNLGHDLDRSTRGGWLVECVAEGMGLSVGVTIVDCVRSQIQLDMLRATFGAHSVYHVHLWCDDATAKQRYMSRCAASLKDGGPPEFEYEIVQRVNEGRIIDQLGQVADLVLDVGPRGHTAYDAAFVVARLVDGPGGRPGEADVLIGGQWGSEGKGQIASHIAPDYALVVRAGGPNAGHSVKYQGKKLVYYHVPSGTGLPGHPPGLIGAGALISVPTLLAECERNGVVLGEDLLIDRRAMLITAEDRAMEAELRSTIGSTRQGVGRAAIRRIERDASRVRFAADERALESAMCDGVKVMAKCLAFGDRILVEGTQGAGLSLYYGDWPCVTSRDTSASGVCSEIGLSPRWVADVWMVVRSYPIRVQSPEDGTSGPMGRELDWDTIARWSGLEPAGLAKAETTTTTKRSRRVAAFNWEEFGRACLINRPTKLVATFLDYFSIANRKAADWRALTPRAHDFVRELEIVSGARVVMGAVGFGEEHVLKRPQP